MAIIGRDHSGRADPTQHVSSHPVPDPSLGTGDFVYRSTFVPVIKKAYASILEGADGRRYLAAEAANGTAGLGFDVNVLRSAQQRCNDLPVCPSFCESELRLEVARKISKAVYEVTDEPGRVAFELGGAQAIELALKIVRLNTNRSQYAVFAGGYHGRSGLASQLSASHRYRSILGDWRIPVVRLPFPDCEQCPFGKRREDCALECVSFVDHLTKHEQGGVVTNRGEPDVAALLLEAVQNAGGIVRPDPQYLESAVARFRQLGALIVVDETFTGFYRTGTLFAFQHYNFKPDLIVMGKGLTNGIVPLSCVWAREPLLDCEHFPPGSHSATYVNNAFGLSVADTVLDRYEDWRDRDQAIGKLETRLKLTVNELVRRFPVARSGYALGGLARVLLSANVAGQVADLARSIAWESPYKGIHGLFLANTGLAPNVVAVNPPLTINSDELDCLHQLLVRTLEKFEASR